MFVLKQMINTLIKRPYMFRTSTIQSSLMVQQRALQLNIIKQDNMPILQRKPDKLLIQQWWSQTPFDHTKPLIVPVFSFLDGKYSGQSVELNQTIFNLPLRRDIIHKVYLWRYNLFKIQTHRTLTVGTVAGSGKKHHQQKGLGIARLGNKRAPHLKKGGKTFGPTPREFRYPIPKKIRLLALKTMLSAKLAEGKLRIIDKEDISESKTKILNQIINKTDETSTILIIHSYSPNNNFLRAQENISRLEICEPNRINIMKLLKNDRIFITLDGLRQLQQDLLDRTYLQYRIRLEKRVPLSSEIDRQQLKPLLPQNEKVTYDPSKPMELKFQILKDYLVEYEKVKKAGKLDQYSKPTNKTSQQ